GGQGGTGRNGVLVDRDETRLSDFNRKDGKVLQKVSSDTVLGDVSHHLFRRQPRQLLGLRLHRLQAVSNPGQGGGGCPFVFIPGEGDDANMTKNLERVRNLPADATEFFKVLID